MLPNNRNTRQTSQFTLSVKFSKPSFYILYHIIYWYSNGCYKVITNRVFNGRCQKAYILLVLTRDISIPQMKVNDCWLPSCHINLINEAVRVGGSFLLTGKTTTSTLSDSDECTVSSNPLKSWRGSLEV